MHRSSDTFKLFQDLNLSFTKTQNTWKVRQTNALDAKTNFIYSINSFSELSNYFEFTSNFTPDEKIYAEHRWRNFKRHDAWLALIIESWPNSRLVEDSRDKSKDFSTRIGDSWLDFDLKVTRYPKSVALNLNDQQLASWMYTKQSTQIRFHLKNRVFVIAQPESSIYEYELARSVVQQSGRSLTKHLIEVQLPNNQIRPKAIVLRV